MTDTDSGPDALDCGKTLEEISDYLAHDRFPYDPTIEQCPECMNALHALERVSQLSRDLITDDAQHLPPPPVRWLESIIDNIRTELRSGRDFPLRHDDPPRDPLGHRGRRSSPCPRRRRHRPRTHHGILPRQRRGRDPR